MDTLYIHLGGSCPLREICQLQSSLCVQVLHSPILGALLHGTAAAASGKLCGAEQRVPPLFGMAAITLGIGPHFSLYSFAALDKISAELLVDFWAMNIFLELVKLDTLNLVCRSVLTCSSACMIDYPQVGCVQGHVTCLNFGK